MSDNLVRMIRPFIKAGTPIICPKFRKHWARVKQMAGYGEPTEKNQKLEPWTQDILRHTGISHHLAQHQHEGKTATWAGNSPNMIHQCYKGLVTSKEAKEFWSIRPTSV